MAVTGIGGIIFRAKDHKALTEWYEKHLGINGVKWEQQAGPTAFAPSASDTEYIGNMAQSFMLNFRVDDLDGLLSRLKADNVKIAKDLEEYEGMGRFVWIEDPEGNRIELWEPEASS
jgi:predicted enzyme related to lactoylglutathione lyase